MSDSKKTRNLPNISDCNSCNRHIPNPNKNLTNPNNNYNQTLITLQSFWRVVLLCTTCFDLIKKAQNCLYCYRPANSENSHKCPNCECLVHKECVIESSNSPPFSYCHKKSLNSNNNVDFRVCLDCWVPKGLEMEYRRNKGTNRVKKSKLGTSGVKSLKLGTSGANNLKLGTSNEKTAAGVSNDGRRSKKKVVARKSPALSEKVCENGKELKSYMEGEVRVSSDVEKEIFLSPRAKGKAIVAKGKPEVVKRALEFENGIIKFAKKRGEMEKNEHLIGCTSNDYGLGDAELAFKLHREMNSSARISRRVALGSSLEPSGRFNFTYKRRGSGSRLNDNVEKIGACLEPSVKVTSSEEGGSKHELLVYTRKCNKCNATIESQVKEVVPENDNMVSENRPSQDLLVYKRKCKKCDITQVNEEFISEDGMIFENQITQVVLVYQRKCKKFVENQGKEGVVPENGIVPENNTHHSQDVLVYKRKHKEVRQENGVAVREYSIDSENENLDGSDRWIVKYKKRAVTWKKCTNGDDMNIGDGR